MHLRMSKSNFVFCLFLFTLFFKLFITNSFSKPLTKEVLRYLDEDKSTFTSYKNQYKVLACKLLTYGKMKNLYDEEIIDKFLIQTENKMGFLDLLQVKTQEKCMKTLENNMEIFELNLFVNWDNKKDKFVDVDLTNLLANFTRKNNEENKTVKIDL